MITDKDKAAEIALENIVEYHTIDDDGTEHLTHCYQECKKSALEMAKYKNKQIKEAIDNVLNYYQYEANQDLSTSTKALYLNNFAVVREAMNLLKQKLNLED